MKRLSLLLLALVSFASVTFAQDNSEKGILGNFSLEVNTLGTYKYHHIREMGADINLGYQFVPRLYVFAHYESTTGLYDHNDVKTHFSSKALGGGLGYTFAKEDNGGKWDLRLLAAQNIGGNDWKKTVYDAGIQWKILSGVSPTISLGYRHENSHTSGIPNMNVIYGKIGIRL